MTNQPKTNQPTFQFMAAVIAALALAGCGGGSNSTSSSSSSTGSSSASCDYDDLISSSERSQANACGIQVSANYAQADFMLESVIAACQKGEITTANNYYNSTYRQAVNYARSAADALGCGDNNTTTLPELGTTSYYNLCVRTTATVGSITRESYCYGPFKRDDSQCDSGDGYSFLSQHSSSSACSIAGTNWNNNR